MGHPIIIIIISIIVEHQKFEYITISVTSYMLYCYKGDFKRDLKLSISK